MDISTRNGSDWLTHGTTRGWCSRRKLAPHSAHATSIGRFRVFCKRQGCRVSASMIFAIPPEPSLWVKMAAWSLLSADSGTQSPAPPWICTAALCRVTSGKRRARRWPLSETPKQERRPKGSKTVASNAEPPWTFPGASLWPLWPLTSVVAQGGIEPPTRGFSVRNAWYANHRYRTAVPTPPRDTRNREDVPCCRKTPHMGAP